MFTWNSASLADGSLAYWLALLTESMFMTETEKTGERIAKRIAAAGICSRRDAEKLIEKGKVEVNGKRIHSPALNVNEADIIKVNGELLQTKNKPRLWMYHKPTGLLTTHKDTHDRPTVFASLPKTMPRVISVGRLDMNSEGLLMLTTDGALARALEHPSTGLERRYRIRVFGKPTDADLKSLLKGVTVDGVMYGKIVATLERETGSNCWIEVKLSEGKNREIRKVFQHLGYSVNRLIRTHYGPFTLGSLPRGELLELPDNTFKKFLG